MKYFVKCINYYNKDSSLQLLMGNKQQQKMKTGLDDQTQLIKEYTPPYQKLKENPNYFIQLLVENTVFGQNLFQLFPDASKTFESFFEMILFLRREQAKFQINKYAIHNGQQTSLLDRFFMIVLKIEIQEFENKIVNLEQIDELLINYFKLFLEKPEKGSAIKVLKFMKVEQTQVSLKQFSANFREYFPHVQKYLKDYYLVKFRELQKNGLILKQFTSKIITNDAVLLALKIPKLSTPEIVELYNTEKYGLSFHSIEGRLIGYTGPWLMLIHHYQKNQKGQRQYYVFGTYQNGPIRSVMTYQGDVTGFMFAIHPNIKFFGTDKGDGANHYFYVQSIPEQKCKKRKGFGFGGNKDHKNFKLWVDQDLQKSTVFNGKDPTYGYGSLASASTQKISIKRMQIWGLGNRHNIQQQQQYWKERQQQITRRRKVDKKQLLGQSAQLFFQKTFAHRSDVIGEIQKPKDKSND